MDRVLKVFRTALVIFFLSFSSAGWAASIQSIDDMSGFLAEPHPFDVRPPVGKGAPPAAPVPAPIPAPAPIIPGPAYSPIIPAAGTPIPNPRNRPPAPAAKADGGVWLFEFENEDRGFLEDPFDAIFDTFYGDRDDKTGHLTWAWKVAYAPNRNPDWFKSARGYIRWLVGGKNARVSYSLQQSGSVPTSFNSDNEIADRPYVGLLLANLRATFAGEFQGSYQAVDNLNLSLGLAGEASGASVVHRNVHSLIGRRSRSWNEITSEPVIGLQYEKGARFVFGVDKLGFEAFPHAGVTLGNLYTYAAAGATLRVGSHLRKDSGAPRMRMITVGTNFPTPGRYFVWNLFIGIEGRAVAYNIMIDGNTFDDTSLVDRDLWVLDSQVGAELGWGAYRLSVMTVYRTKEFSEQEQDDVFMRAALSMPL